MLFRNTSWYSLSITALIFPLFLFVSGSLVEAKTDPKTVKSSVKKKAIIDGFRSAKFGMTEKQVSRAIRKDFNISSSKIKRQVQSLEKTFSLNINVPKLLATGGPSIVGYIFGHQSKQLSHINIIWGNGVSKKVDGQSVVDTANLLRNHFLKKKYKTGVLTNAKLNDTTTIVFRGTDEKNRMALLTLIVPKKLEDETSLENSSRATLKLSYILDHQNPDILTIKEGDF
jgi:hypothetical protein